MLFFLVSFHLLFSCSIFFVYHLKNGVHSNYVHCLACSYCYVQKGCFPNFEVRMMNKGSEDKTVERKPYLHDSLEKENGSVVEDILQIERLSHEEIIS